MVVFVVVIILLCLLKINFKEYKKIDEKALSIEKTTCINGVFVLIILLSHLFPYLTLTSKIDLFISNFVMEKIGQLMVTTFLFFSGFGIYESIKNKKDYIDNFFKKRFLKVYIPFVLAMCLFLIMNLILKIDFPLKTILLSFTALEGIGNSNWFMFCIFCLYLSTLISFKVFKDNRRNALILNTILSLIYIFILIKLNKYSFWYNTSLCYIAGMWFSYFKERIIKLLKPNKTYILFAALSIVSFFILYPERNSWVAYSILSIIFVFLIILISFKVKFGNKILYIIGKNTFNIYILQRISYTVYQYLKLDQYNIYLYSAISILTTFILAFIFDKLIKQIFKIIKL